MKEFKKYVYFATPASPDKTVELEAKTVRRVKNERSGFNTSPLLI